MTVGPEPDLIEVGDFAVVVTPICSGADGLGLVVLLQATWIALARERLRVSRALLLIPLGMALALGANMARIATLLWVGGSGHEDLAAGGLHSKLGWILFIGIALGSIAMAERIPWFRRPSPEHHVETGALPAAAAAYVAPLLAALVAALVTSIWSDGALDRWYVARVLAATGRALARSPRPALGPRSRRPGSRWSRGGSSVPPGSPWSRWTRRQGHASSVRSRVWARRSDGAGSPYGSSVRACSSRWWRSWRSAGSSSAGWSRPSSRRVPPRAATWPAVLLSSLAFGALHDHWVLGTLGGLVFAVAWMRRGRLADAILAHALANASIAVAVLGFGRWDLWG